MRALFGLLLLVAAAVPLITGDQYYLHILITLGFNVTLALSLTLVMVAGNLSIAHAAFMGIGAYVSAVLVMRAGLPFWSALPLAGAVSGVVGALLGIPALRVKGANFAILTFSFGEIVRLVFVGWISLFGGAGGLVGIPAPGPLSLGPVAITFDDKRTYYYLVLALVALAAGVVSWFLRTHVGRVLRAIAASELLTMCSGVDIVGYRLLNFTVACALAGLAGSLYAHYVHYISPDSFSFIQSIEIITYVVLGGTGTVAGPVIGAMLLTLLSEVLRRTGPWELVLYAVSLMAVLLLLPNGLVGWRRARWFARSVAGGAREAA